MLPGPHTQTVRLFTPLGSFHACPTTPVITDTTSILSREDACIFWSLSHSCAVPGNSHTPPIIDEGAFPCLALPLCGKVSLGAHFSVWKSSCNSKARFLETGPLDRGSAHVTFDKLPSPNAGSSPLKSQDRRSPFSWMQFLNPGSAYTAAFLLTSRVPRTKKEFAKCPLLYFLRASLSPQPT